MKPDHVRMHAPGVHGVAADFAKDSGSGVGDRLLEPRLGFQFFPALGFAPQLFTFRRFPTGSQPPAIRDICHIGNSFRSDKVAHIPASAPTKTSHSAVEL